MDIPGEIIALRGEHNRLRNQLDSLDGRIRALEHPPAPEPAPRPIFVTRESPKPRPPAAQIARPEPIFKAEPPPLPEPLPTPKARQLGTPSEPESLELHLGRVWLVRIGIVILLTGLVFLGNYAYQEFIGRLGAGGKLALIYLAGAALGAFGGWLARRQAAMRNYGRVLLAGGCATIYYATYAAHFVPTLRVISSPLIGGALLLALGGIFAVLADRRRSQLLAGATIALSFYTAAINPSGNFSLFGNLIISAVAVALLARRRWISVTFLSLAGSYGSFAFWRFHATGTLLPFPAPDAATFWTALLFPLSYWAVHTVAVLLRRMNGLAPQARPAFLTINNAALFALAGPMIAGTYPDAFWLATVGFGATLLALAAVAARLAPAELRFDRAYLAQGLTMVMLGAFLKFSGWQLALGFAMASATLIGLGRLRHGGVYRFFAGASALAASYLALADLVRGHDHSRLVAAGVAAILTIDGWLLKRATGFGPRLDWRTFGFVTLAAGLAAAACLDTAVFSSALRLLAVAAVALVLVRWHRLPEAAYLAQPLAFFGQTLLAIRFITDPNPATLTSALAGLGFLFLWDWQSRAGFAGRRIWQSLHLLGPIGLGLAWNLTQLSTGPRSPILAAMALGVLALGLVSRQGVLAAAAIPFSLVAMATTAVAIANHLPWADPALAIALIGAPSLFISRFGNRVGLDETTSGTLRSGLHFATLALGVGMVFAYLPEASWFLALAGLGFAFFVAASFTLSAEALFYAAALGTFALVIWTARIPVAPASWTDAFGFLAFAVAQRLGRRRLTPAGRFGAGVQASLCLIAGLGAWILLHRLAADVAGGFLVTIAWSLLALVLLGVGFALKERSYRQLGLVLLGAAVTRIFIVDVWQLATLYRILSFLVLGGVLLALGFLYNRFAETLRKWL
ncbi:MAG TPA: DUF2339 domain-containing protein [Chthoniobacterales bacterium]